MRDPAERFVAIGRILKPHGVHGEVKVALLTDDPRRFAHLERVFCLLPDGARRVLHLESSRAAGPEAVLLTFREIASPEVAQELRHAVLEIPRREAPPLPPGKVYFADVIGLEAYDALAQAPLGTVTAVVSAGHDLLEITTPQGEELLVPWVDSWVSRIDPEAGRVWVTPLPGWRES